VDVSFEHGVAVLEFWIHIVWLHVDPDEQLSRFQDREKTPFEQYQITEEEYRNHERRAASEVAVNERVACTDQSPGPLARDRRQRRAPRLEALKIFCKSLERTHANA
jgi:polyphosphate kinase 2 (PPK2 family)